MKVLSGRVPAMLPVLLRRHAESQNKFFISVVPYRRRAEQATRDDEGGGRASAMKVLRAARPRTEREHADELERPANDALHF
jgi:hypothetical protein